MPRSTTLNTHPLITVKVRTLEAGELDAHIVVAESLLGCTDLAVVKQTDCDELDMAVISQVNYQVEAGLDGLLMQEARRGSRNIVYRGTNRMNHINRISLNMVRAIKLRLGVL